MTNLDLVTRDDLDQLRRELAELRAQVAARAGSDLSAEEAAAQLGVAPKTIRRWAREGRIRATLQWASHGRPGDVVGSYTEIEWATLCAEVGKLRAPGGRRDTVVKLRRPRG